MLTIITPPDPGPAALADLKDWLAITGTREDALLTRLLASATALCDAFTGTAPLAFEGEALLPATTHWQTLPARPVTAIVRLEGVPAAEVGDGARFAFGGGDYLFDLTADGGGRVRLLSSGNASGIATRVAVRFLAGMASQWSGVPEGLRQGIVRMAAHQYRARTAGEGERRLPAAIAALWQPYRRMALGRRLEDAA